MRNAEGGPEQQSANSWPEHQDQFKNALYIFQRVFLFLFLFLFLSQKTL